MSLPWLPGAAPTHEPPRRVRWGLWDFVLAWVVGVVVSALIAPGVPDPRRDAIGLFLLLVAQDLPQVGYLAWAARAKGLGTLRRDFGFVVRRADWPWLLGGAGLQLAAVVLLAPLSELYGRDANQDVVRLAERATGLEIPLIVLGVAVLAPVVEELLFRGALLRGLMRRTTPGWAVFTSAAVFGVLHLADGSIGSVMAVPAIVGLGVISARQAVATGDLSRSILLHVGFNALTAVFLFT